MRVKQPAREALIAIFGPTAVGKSRVAPMVARAVRGEIVSADSMQVYRGLAVLTDQPSADDMAEVPHHLVGTVPLTEEYSAGRFAREAAEIVRAVNSRGNLPLLAGGTGLYVRALVGGFSFAGQGSEALRRKWEKFVKEKGTEAALAELKRLDPEAATSIDRHNHRRLVRALEAAEAQGPPLFGERGRLWSAESPYQVLCFGLTMPRVELYRRIDERVDRMLAAGAIEEVREANRQPVSRTASQAIGYSEISGYLNGDLALDEAAAAIKQKSRRYAKRQMTWMRNMPDIVKIDLAGRSSTGAAQSIIEHVKSVYAI